MLSIDEIAAKLDDRRLDKVATATGLHQTTIARIRDGRNTNPCLNTIRLLSD